MYPPEKNKNKQRKQQEKEKERKNKNKSKNMLLTFYSDVEGMFGPIKLA
jgi:hypothetical protein